MDLPNAMLGLEIVVAAICVGNGLLGLRRRGLWLGHRLVFRIDQPRLWRAALVWTFGLAALLALHIVAVLIVRIAS